MESLLQFLAGAVFWLALISLVGGVTALAIDHVLFTHRRNQVWKHYHHPWWDKDGIVRPKHLHCYECELEVERMGGEPEGHSALE